MGSGNFFPGRYRVNVLRIPGVDRVNALFSMIIWITLGTLINHHNQELFNDPDSYEETITRKWAEEVFLRPGGGYF